MIAKPFRFAALLAGLCAAVGALAAIGWFDSMMMFPVVFAAVILVLGAISLWRDPGPKLTRAAIVALGAALAVAGWSYNVRLIEVRLSETQRQVFASLGGKPAPALSGLERLSEDPAAFDAAAGFLQRATIVSFWATWCSPCWTEMVELQELYERHRERGLTVLAVTAYDSETAEGRGKDRSKAEKFLRRRGLEYPAAITAEGDNYRRFEVSSIPSSALIDENGILVAYAVGLDSARELMARAEALVTARH